MNGEQRVRSALSGLPRPVMPDSVRRAVEQRLEIEAAADVVALPPVHRRRLTGLVAAASFAAFAALLGAGMPKDPQPVAREAPLMRAGAVYTPGGFGNEVASRFAARPTTQPTGTFADNPAEISECVRAVRAYGVLLAVDTGSYDASAAVVLITRSPMNFDYEEVWVVTPACGPRSGQVLRHMVNNVDGIPDGRGLGRNTRWGHRG
jgi:hypothetical protein